MVAAGTPPSWNGQGGRRGSVGGRERGRLELAAGGVGRPRQSSSGVSPAQPIATSTWPAPGPAEAVGDGHGDDRSNRHGDSALRRRAEASGSSGSGRTVPGSAGWSGRSGVARRNPGGFRRSGRCPRRAGPRGSPEDQLDQAGSLPSTAASLRASAPGITAERLRTLPRPWRRSCGRRQRRRPLSSARSATRHR